MTDETLEPEKSAAETAVEPIPKRALDWTLRVWRPAGTVVAVGLAMLLTWHVINGKHGLQVWHQKRAEDQQLRKDIKELEQENADLRQRIDRLRNSPDAIEHEAREKLHYAKPNEVIVALPPQQTTQGPAAGTTK
jgi:cell division protein FtsB